METKRVERLLALIQTLQTGRSSTAEDLADLIGVSKRTVFRDLDILRRSGLRFDFERVSKRYSIDRSALLPPASFSHGEALALMMALKAVEQHPSLISPETTTGALLKVEGMLPAEMREYCRPLVESVELRHAPASDTTSLVPTLPLLLGALARRAPIEVRYDSYFERAVIDDVLEPYRLSFINRAWYVIARSQRSDEVRTFKVERIVQLKVLTGEYQIDPQFSLDDYFGNAWSMIRGERRFHVRIRFAAQVAANVDEVVWHKTQRTSHQPDGSMLFEADVDGIGEIVWWVLGYGDRAEVLEPSELRELISRHAANMSRMYASTALPTRTPLESVMIP